jgi:hypothetical protein
MKGNRSKNLPAFRSVDGFVAFFETHDMGDYWEKLPEVEVEVSIRNSKRISAKTKAKSSTNTGKRWTPTQVTQLRKLASQKNSAEPEALANTVKHFAFTRCGEFNVFGMVDDQVAVVEGKLLAF